MNFEPGKAMVSGPFIVFEGLDGAGTTTQLGLLQGWIERVYSRRVFPTREPSGGPIGSLLQQALRRRVTFDARTMAALFAADRIDHLNTDVIPKLQDGILVLCDRYYLSSFAYQLRDLPDELEWLMALNCQAIKPDLTMLIDASAEVCMARIRKARWQTELYEEETRLAAVRQNYLTIAGDKLSQTERVELIDGNRPPEVVHAEICALVEPMLRNS